MGVAINNILRVVVARAGLVALGTHRSLVVISGRMPLHAAPRHDTTTSTPRLDKFANWNRGTGESARSGLGLETARRAAAAAAAVLAEGRKCAHTYAHTAHPRRSASADTRCPWTWHSECIKRNPPPTKLNSNQQNRTRTRHKTYK